MCAWVRRSSARARPKYEEINRVDIRSFLATIVYWAGQIL